MNSHRPNVLGSTLIVCAGLLAQSVNAQILKPELLPETADTNLGLDWRWELEEQHSLPLPGDPMPSSHQVVQRPLVFEPNQGQTAGEVAFLSRGRGYTLFLTKDEAVMMLETAAPHARADRLGLRQPSAAFAPHAADSTAPEDWRTPKPYGGTAEVSNASCVLRMRLSGANPNATVSGRQPQRAKAHYFIGNDPSRWRKNIPTFGKIRFDGVYEGIDLVYYGNEGQLEYDFVVAPGADPNQIAMEFDGAEGLKVDEDGDLVLDVGGREVRWQKPLIYQEVNGKRMEIAGRYRLGRPLNRSIDLAATAHSTTAATIAPTVQFVTFELAAFDQRLPLVIDPILLYSTYLGGDADDGGHGVAVDGEGNVYVTGPTASTDFPTRNALYDQIGRFQNDVFIAKFSPVGELLFSTYLGGSGNDGALFDPVRIGLSPSGECYVVGATASRDFPLVNPVQESLAGGAGDAFVSALTADGSALTFSTYLGGSFGEGARNLAFGPTGDIYVVGSTFSADFPVLNAFQPEMAVTDGTNRDAFIVRLGATDKEIVFSTFYGAGTTGEWATDVAVDAEGNSYSALWTGGQWVLVKLGQDGRTRYFERKWPTSPADGKNIGLRPLVALAPNETVVLAGYAWGLPLPASNQPHPSTNPTLSMGTDHGFPDTYLALFNATDGTFRTAVYFGGAGADSPSALCVNEAGEIVIAGSTSGAYLEPSGFPVTDPLESSLTPGTSQDVFVAKFRPSDLSLSFSTLFGGPGDEAPTDMALDARGNPWVVGSTQTWRTDPQLPTLNAFQPQPGGGDDAFLVHLSLRDARVQITRSGEELTVSWPVQAADYVLEAATSLTADSWTPVSSIPTINDNDRTVQLPVTGNAQFFRLRKP